VFSTLVASVVLSTLLVGQTGSSTVTAQPDVTPPAAEDTTREKALPVVEEPKQKSALEAVNWKLITKSGAGALYAAWVGLWIIAVPVTGIGLLLLGMSVAGGTAMLGGGAVLVGVGLVAGALGLIAVTGAVACAIPLTILQLINPDDAAADASILTMFMPRTLLL